ncbi:hypothetical protein [Arthrobacter sedimenti]|uniref:hypothetical protein n=1 Tax=Arthrobacter sedimenti TaxID=2694931 RepID=UPI000B577F02|nr:hypothetical protein [Arthrobacter sedimenti]OUM39808.1 hypothetical protein B8W73_15290 [Arthrobacter agilis]
MKILTSASRIALLVLVAVTALLRPPDERDDGEWNDGERGDVPGWVMITLMSAVLVAALLAIAGPALEGLFNQAINQVSP